MHIVTGHHSKRGNTAADGFILFGGFTQQVLPHTAGAPPQSRRSYTTGTPAAQHNPIQLNLSQDGFKGYITNALGSLYCNSN